MSGLARRPRGQKRQREGKMLRPTKERVAFTRREKERGDFKRGMALPKKGAGGGKGQSETCHGEATSPGVTQPLRGVLGGREKQQKLSSSKDRYAGGHEPRRKGQRKRSLERTVDQSCQWSGKRNNKEALFQGNMPHEAKRKVKSDYVRRPKHHGLATRAYLEKADVKNVPCRRITRYWGKR